MCTGAVLKHCSSRSLPHVLAAMVHYVTIAIHFHGEPLLSNMHVSRAAFGAVPQALLIGEVM